jgi:hypothetical protein
MFFHDSSAPINYNSEGRCLFNGTVPYSLDASVATPDLINGSSINLYKIMKSFGKPTEYYLDCQAHHGLDADGANFKSDYGTHDTTAHDVYVYIVQRTCIFFQAVLNNLTSSFSNTKYVECENMRYISKPNNQCIINNNAGCNDGHECFNP